MQFRDLLLPVTLMLVVGMMVFPLPVALLDFLLVCNITLALILLLSSVYLSEPEKFTALPTVLLLATLFRLGLNISTTRQLLGQGTAPDVVTAFGEIVVGGNIVVGIVIFLIVTLVQFLVIAKGAERVAEVAARFTLDAMPGKQMAIDADVRAGILSLSEAREKRRELHRESKLYGALDGAMKFVKGDAIAGLVITAINISAGFVVGVMQQGLTASEAAFKYSLFTVGDGLVSQIPALLTAVAAGIAVTRVADKEGSSVGREVIAQLGKEPQALSATGAVLLFLGCVPGFSLAMFGAMAFVFFCCAARTKRTHAASAAADTDGSFRPQVLAGLSLRLSPPAVVRLQEERLLPGRVQEFRQQVFERFGLVISDVPFEIGGSPNVAEVCICFHGALVRTISWQAKTNAHGLLSDAVRSALEEVFLRYRTELVDDTQTRVLLEAHLPSCEDLANSLIPKAVSVTVVTRLLRVLIAERVSVRSLPVILQAIAECTAEKKSETPEREMLCAVRIALRRTITNAICGDGRKVSAWVLSSELDHLLARSLEASAAVSPELCESIEERMEQLLLREPDAVIIATRYARKLLADILADRFPNLFVVAAEELTDDVRLTVLGELRLGSIPEQDERGSSLEPSEHPQ